MLARSVIGARHGARRVALPAGQRVAAARPAARPWLSAAPRWLSASAAGRSTDPYAVLGLPPDAPPETVKLTYYKMAMVHHPDHSKAPDAPERFAEIGEAYEAIMGEDPAERSADPFATDGVPEHLKTAKFASAFPKWVYRLMEYLQRVPQRLDLWLAPTDASAIYQHLLKNELAEALSIYEAMRSEGERPTHAVYEMLIRGCTIAMKRPAPRRAADHLTLNLVQKVLDLWGDMLVMDRKPDYLTHIELLRALGKGGAVPQALELFEKMCGTVQLLPEERAFNSMYEACVLSGHYKEALQVFDEHEEMRLSLWKPRYTPVSFSLLITASAEAGPGEASRIEALPRVLKLMGTHGIMPRVDACERLLGACLKHGELGAAAQVLQLAGRAGHTLDAALLSKHEQAKVQAALAVGAGRPRPLGAGAGAPKAGPAAPKAKPRGPAGLDGASAAAAARKKASNESGHG